MSANVQPASDQLESILHAAIAEDMLELPSPPQIAAEVLRVTQAGAVSSGNADEGAAEIARLIERDLALAGQVMRVANSAVYARRTPVVTLQQAIAWLGMQTIHSIAFAVAVRGHVFASGFFRNQMNDLWRESVITALFSQEVARLKQRNEESAYLCGLLHRIGLAVILSRLGPEMAKHRLNPEPGDVLELAARHEARVGTHLAIAWKLPLAISASISHWRVPRAAEESRVEVMEVALARQISDELRTPGVGGELPDSMLGPVSAWMDELSIYPDELFSVMARRAAIYATAESYG